jgi:N-methylhydantoinase A/oxoprolinase/acetone carboxylase beta subunit
LLALRWPTLKDHLSRQLDLAVPMATDARFVFPIMPDGVPQWLTRSEIRLAEKAIAAGPAPVAELAATQLALGAVDRLISRGLLGLSSFTPTDAAHVTGAFNEFNDEAAMLGAKLMARQRNGAGIAIAATTLDELHRRSALALMDAALAHEGGGEAAVSSNPLLAQSFRKTPASKDQLVSVGVKLNTDLIALGASAATHYPPIANMVGIALMVPDHADVAGAVGAAAGSVRQRVMVSITQPAETKFRIHLADGPIDKSSLDVALAAARIAAKQLAEARAKAAGATKIDLHLEEDIKLVPLSSNKDLFIEALIYATAEGRAT